MTDVLVMCIADGAEDLVEDVPSFVLRHAGLFVDARALLLEILQQVSTIHQFEYQHHVVDRLGMLHK